MFKSWYAERNHLRASRRPGRHGSFNPNAHLTLPYLPGLWFHAFCFIKRSPHSSSRNQMSRLFQERRFIMHEVPYLVSGLLCDLRGRALGSREWDVWDIGKDSFRQRSNRRRGLICFMHVIEHRFEFQKPYAGDWFYPVVVYSNGI